MIRSAPAADSPKALPQPCEQNPKSIALGRVEFHHRQERTLPVTGTVEWAQSTWGPTERRRTCDTPLEVAERLLTQGSILQAAARRTLVPERQRDLGQYFTPMWVARLMASMAPHNCDPVRILDPGAGAGTLFTAYVAQCLRQDSPPRSISVTAFELDPAMRPFLQGSADAVRRACELRSVPCEVELRFEDFAQRASREWLGHLFSAPETFDAAILNPPYRKLSAGSDLRARLDGLGISAPNLYAAFVGLALAAVKPGGTVVAILPRSFCNGVYFAVFDGISSVPPMSVGFTYSVGGTEPSGRMPCFKRMLCSRCSAGGDRGGQFRSPSAMALKTTRFGVGEPAAATSCAGTIPICSSISRKALGAFGFRGS